jgi:Flp pilus assembly protein TadG
VAAQRGQVIVELAAVTTFLLFLLAGLIDLAPALISAAHLSQAVREGVDYGHMFPNATTEIRTRVRKAAPDLTMTDGNITVSCFVGTSTTTRVCADAVIGDTVTVQATTVYVPKTGLFSGLVGGNITLTRSATSVIY